MSDFRPTEAMADAVAAGAWSLSTYRCVVALDGCAASWRAADYAVGLARRQSRAAFTLFVLSPSSRSLQYLPEYSAQCVIDRATEVTQVSRELTQSFGPAGATWALQVGSTSLVADVRRIARQVRADVVVVGARCRDGGLLSRRMATALSGSGQWPVVAIP